MRQESFPTTRRTKVELRNGRRGVEANGDDHARINTKPQRSDGPEELKIEQEKCDFGKKHRRWG